MAKSRLLSANTGLVQTNSLEFDLASHIYSKVTEGGDGLAEGEERIILIPFAGFNYLPRTNCKTFLPEDILIEYRACLSDDDADYGECGGLWKPDTPYIEIAPEYRCIFGDNPNSVGFRFVAGSRFNEVNNHNRDIYYTVFWKSLGNGPIVSLEKINKGIERMRERRKRILREGDN